MKNKKGNPVPSIDFNFTTDNIILLVKCPEDWRKPKKWEQVTNLEYMFNGNYWICKTYKFGWSKLKNCKIKQNGVETDNEVPEEKNKLESLFKSFNQVYETVRTIKIKN
jgi:hypothetical protein